LFQIRAEGPVEEDYLGQMKNVELCLKAILIFLLQEREVRGSAKIDSLP
jgi:hypothetical protein